MGDLYEMCPVNYTQESWGNFKDSYIKKHAGEDGFYYENDEEYGESMYCDDDKLFEIAYALGGWSDDSRLPMYKNSLWDAKYAASIEEPAIEESFRCKYNCIIRIVSPTYGTIYAYAQPVEIAPEYNEKSFNINTNTCQWNDDKQGYVDVSYREVFVDENSKDTGINIISDIQYFYNADTGDYEAVKDVTDDFNKTYLWLYSFDIEVSGRLYDMVPVNMLKTEWTNTVNKYIMAHADEDGFYYELSEKDGQEYFWCDYDKYFEIAENCAKWSNDHCLPRFFNEKWMPDWQKQGYMNPEEYGTAVGGSYPCRYGCLIKYESDKYGTFYRYGAPVKVTIKSAGFTFDDISDLICDADKPSGYTDTVTVNAQNGYSDISYQWYKSNSRDYNGTAIDGATSNSYDAAYPDEAGRRYYYYCEMTFYDEDGIQQTERTSVISLTRWRCSEPHFYLSSTKLMVSVGSEAYTNASYYDYYGGLQYSDKFTYRFYITNDPDSTDDAQPITEELSFTDGSSLSKQEIEQKLTVKIPTDAVNDFYVFVKWTNTYRDITVEGCTNKRRITVTDDPEQFFGFDKDTGTITAYYGSDAVLNVPQTISGVAVKKFDASISGSSNVQKIIFPEGMESVGNRCFSSNSTIKEVVFSSTVTTIGDYAFYNCTNLTTVTFGTGLTKIGTYAFAYCGLESVKFNNTSALSIGTYAFTRCNSLMSIEFSDAERTSCSSYAFSYCPYFTHAENTSNVSNLSGASSSYCPMGVIATTKNSEYVFGDKKYIYIYYPDKDAYAVCGLLSNDQEQIFPSQFNGKPVIGVTCIEDNFGNLVKLSGFTSIWGINSITLPEGYEFIGENVFKELTTLKEITLPKSIKSIGKKAFYNLENLTDVNIPDDCMLESIGQNAFLVDKSGQSSSLQNCDLSKAKNLKTVGANAFKNCTELTLNDLYFGQEAVIDNYAFYNCGNISGDITFKGSPTIGVKAFCLLENVISVDIEGKPTIGQDAFDGCYSIQSVTIGGSTYNGETDTNKIINGTLGYPYDRGFSHFRYTLACPIVHDSKNGYIYYRSGKYCYYNCNYFRVNGYSISDRCNVYDIYLSKTDTNIIFPAVLDNRKIKAVSSNVMTYHGQDVEYSVVFEDGICLIDTKTDYTAKDYYANKLDAPKVKSTTAYTGCISMKLPDTLILIPEFFLYQSKIKEINIPASVEEISSYAFEQSTIEKVIFNEGNLKYIDTRAFANCSLLNSIRVASKDEETNAVTLSPEDEINFPDSVMYIGYNRNSSMSYSAFEDCTSLSGKLILPKNLREIYESSFRNTAITSVYCESRYLTTIGSANYSYYTSNNGVFTNCKNLTSIDFSKSTLTDVGSFTFYNCTNLNSIALPNTVKYIGWYAFYGIDPAYVPINEGLQRIYPGLKQSASSIADSITLPESIDTLNICMFDDFNTVTILNKNGTFNFKATSSNIEIDTTPTSIREGCLVRCYNGSGVHSWAEQNNINYELIDGDQLRVVLYDNNKNIITRKVLGSIKWRDSAGNLVSEDVGFADYIAGETYTYAITLNDQYYYQYHEDGLTGTVTAIEGGTAVNIYLKEREKLTIRYVYPANYPYNYNVKFIAYGSNGNKITLSASSKYDYNLRQYLYTIETYLNDIDMVVSAYNYKSDTYNSVQLLAKDGYLDYLDGTPLPTSRLLVSTYRINRIANNDNYYGYNTVGSVKLTRLSTGEELTDYTLQRYSNYYTKIILSNDLRNTLNAGEELEVEILPPDKGTYYPAKTIFKVEELDSSGRYSYKVVDVELKYDVYSSIACTLKSVNGTSSWNLKYAIYDADGNICNGNYFAEGKYTIVSYESNTQLKSPLATLDEYTQKRFKSHVNIIEITVERNKNYNMTILVQGWNDVRCDFFGEKSYAYLTKEKTYDADVKRILYNYSISEDAEIYGQEKTISIQLENTALDGEPAFTERGKSLTYTVVDNELIITTTEDKGVIVFNASKSGEEYMAKVSTFVQKDDEYQPTGVVNLEFSQIKFASVPTDIQSAKTYITLDLANRKSYRNHIKLYIDDNLYYDSANSEDNFKLLSNTSNGYILMIKAPYNGSCTFSVYATVEYDNMMWTSDTYNINSLATTNIKPEFDHLYIGLDNPKAHTPYVNVSTNIFEGGVATSNLPFAYWPGKSVDSSFKFTEDVTYTFRMSFKDSDVVNPDRTYLYLYDKDENLVDTVNLIYNDNTDTFDGSYVLKAGVHTPDDRICSFGYKYSPNNSDAGELILSKDYMTKNIKDYKDTLEMINSGIDELQQSFTVIENDAVEDLFVACDRSGTTLSEEFKEDFKKQIYEMNNISAPINESLENLRKSLSDAIGDVNDIPKKLGIETGSIKELIGDEEYSKHGYNKLIDKLVEQKYTRVTVEGSTLYNYYKMDESGYFIYDFVNDAYNFMPFSQDTKAVKQKQMAVKLGLKGDKPDGFLEKVKHYFEVNVIGFIETCYDTLFGFASESAVLYDVECLQAEIADADEKIKKLDKDINQINVKMEELSQEINNRQSIWNNKRASYEKAYGKYVDDVKPNLTAAEKAAIKQPILYELNVLSNTLIAEEEKLADIMAKNPAIKYDAEIKAVVNQIQGMSEWTGIAADPDLLYAVNNGLDGLDDYYKSMKDYNAKVAASQAKINDLEKMINNFEVDAKTKNALDSALNAKTKSYNDAKEALKKMQSSLIEKANLLNKNLHLKEKISKLKTRIDTNKNKINSLKPSFDGTLKKIEKFAAWIGARLNILTNKFPGFFKVLPVIAAIISVGFDVYNIIIYFAQFLDKLNLFITTLTNDLNDLEYGEHIYNLNSFCNDDDEPSWSCSATYHGFFQPAIWALTVFHVSQGIYDLGSIAVSILGILSVIPPLVVILTKPALIVSGINGAAGIIGYGGEALATLLNIYNSAYEVLHDACDCKNISSPPSIGTDDDDDNTDDPINSDIPTESEEESSEDDSSEGNSSVGNSSIGSPSEESSSEESSSEESSSEESSSEESSSEESSSEESSSEESSSEESSSEESSSEESSSEESSSEESSSEESSSEESSSEESSSEGNSSGGNSSGGNSSGGSSSNDTNPEGDGGFTPVPGAPGPMCPVPTPKVADPGGYVYEAVASNRVVGATAKIYFEDEDGNEVPWNDAPYYLQTVTQTTDSFGCYSWYTPDGNWKVKVEKDGYNPATSENDIAAVNGWLPVIPPQLNVNIPMVSTDSPDVAYIAAAQDGIQILFTQYMDINAINNHPDYITVTQNGNPVNVKLTFTDSEESPTLAGVYYGKKLVITTEHGDPITGENIVVRINKNTPNYAGTTFASSYSSDPLSVQQVPGSIEHSYTTRYTIAPGAEEKLAVRVLDTTGKPMSNVELQAELTYDNGIVTLAPVATSAADGVALFDIKGLTAGVNDIIIQDSNKLLKENINLKVSNLSTDRPQKPTANLTDYAEVEVGTKLILSTETEDAKIYYTLNNTCPCSEGPGRFEYTEPIEITQDMYLRIAAYTEKGGYSERLNLHISVKKLKGTPTVSGTAEYGKQLTVSVPDANTTDLVYTWKSGETVLGTGASYTPTKEDIGKTIVCEITSLTLTNKLTAEVTVTKATVANAPSSLTAVDATAYGATDGKITGTTPAMEYITSEQSTPVTCPDGEMTNLKPGTYYIRYKETDTSQASPYIAVTVSDGTPPPPKYTVTVAVNGSGTASADFILAEKGMTVTLTATPSTGWHFVKWQSDDVTVTDNKFIMPDKDITVTAVFEQNSPPIVLVQQIRLDKDELAFTNIGDSKQLNIEIYPSDATNKDVVWSTSDSSVATVDKNGVVMAVGNGDATITATSKDGNAHIDCAVTVTADNQPHDHKQTLEYIPAVAPDCNNNGTKAHYYCPMCDKLYADAEGNTEITDLNDLIIPPVHDYIDGVCADCGAKDPNYSPSGGDSNDDNKKPDSSESPPNSNNQNDKPTSTGDVNDLGGLAAIAFVSGVAILGTIKRKKKRMKG